MPNRSSPWSWAPRLGVVHAPIDGIDDHPSAVGDLIDQTDADHLADQRRLARAALGRLKAAECRHAAPSLRLRVTISKAIRRVKACMCACMGKGRSEVERIQKLFNEVGQERLTRLDRSLVARSKDGILVVSAEQDPLQRSLRIGRLKTLERLGLAEERQQGCGRSMPRPRPSCVSLVSGPTSSR